MKKRVQLAILLLFILLSCTDNADMTERVTGAVGFGTADVASSRASVFTTSDLQKPANGFRVNAYVTGTEEWSVAKDNPDTKPGLMWNQEVTWTGSAWTYTPVKYWPGLVDGTQYGKVSFFAWSDVGTAVEVSPNTASGAPVLTYTVPDNQSAQHDLVTAATPDKIATGGAVTFEFKHVLSRIGFTARLDRQYPGVTVTITSLKVKYANNAVESKGFYTFGETVPWLLPVTGKAHMSHTGDGDVVVDAPGVALNNDATPTETDLTTDTRANYLMLLPQTVADGDVMIEVKWTVNGGIPNNQTVNLPAQTWEPGYRYDYSLRVSLTGITLDPVQVDPWEETTLYQPCTITYKANGGTGQDIVEHRTTGVSYPVGGQYFGRDLYRIGAWTTAPGGTGDTYTAGGNITCTGDMTLYAQWYPVFDGMSNCYMVAPAGTEEFYVSRAFTYEKETFTNTLRTGGEYTDKFAAEVVWQDVTGLITATVDASPGNQAKVTVTTSNNSGNAVVKIYKAGDDTKTPVWSYHIWVTTYPGDNTVTMKNGHVFMDRNLGATTNDLAATAYGLLYQWGRKDPFPGGVENSAGYAARNSFSFVSGNKVTNTTADATGIAAGILESIRNPTKYYAAVNNGDWLPARNNYLWNQQTKNNKTIYDPCPAGWRVPAFKDNTIDKAHSPWMEYDDTKHSAELASRTWKTAGYEFVHTNGEKTYYPAPGLRSSASGFFDRVRAYGYNWSAQATGTYGYCMTIINTKTVNVADGHSRAYGKSVRCVKE